MIMTKNFEDLDNALDIESKIIETVSDSSVILPEKDENSNKDVRKDYEYTRGNLYSLIEKGQEAINGILELAQETDQPRAYEVAGQLIKNVADATDKLLDLQKKLREIENPKDGKSTTNVTNALFVGSTSELSKFLKQQSKDENL